jgi:hypothetical protein
MICVSLIVRIPVATFRIMTALLFLAGTPGRWPDRMAPWIVRATIAAGEVRFSARTV